MGIIMAKLFAPFVITTVASMLVSGLASAKLAGRFGRPIWAWFLLGTFLPVVSLGALIVIGRKAGFGSRGMQ